MKTKKRSLMVAGIACAGVVLSTLALVTCDSTNVLALITTEVKKANNKLLVVTGLVSPASTANVNPGIAITLEFDRPVDTKTVTSSSISIAPTDGSAVDFALAISFSNANKTVTLEPNPFLKDNTSYDIVLSKDVLAEDGSELEKAMSWSFTTGVYPAGNLLITDASGNDISYTKNQIGLYSKIIYKTVADKYRLGNAPTDFNNFADPDAGWRSTILDCSSGAVFQLPPSFALPAGDGSKTVYIQFQRSSTGDMSTVRSDTIILDQTPPTVEAGPEVWVSTGTASPSATASDTNGVASYMWSGVTCSSAANILAPTFSNPGVDDIYPATLTVTDVAGNVGTDTTSLVRDTAPLNKAPTFISVPPAGYLIDYKQFSWSWQGNADNLRGGETPKLFRFRLNYNDPVDGWKPAFVYADKVTSTQYSPKFSPPKTQGLYDLKIHNTIYEPIAYRMYVWETDRLGNLSGAATAADVFVTSVLPYNGQTGVGLTPTLYWRTMYDSLKGVPEGKAYLGYFGEYAGPGKFTLLDRAEITPAKVGEIQSWDISKNKLKLGMTYGWYVVAYSFGKRSPESIIEKEDFWIFTP
jgi:hypothetical protein